MSYFCPRQGARDNVARHSTLLLSAPGTEYNDSHPLPPHFRWSTMPTGA